MTRSNSRRGREAYPTSRRAAYRWGSRLRDLFWVGQMLRRILRQSRFDFSAIVGGEGEPLAQLFEEFTHVFGHRAVLQGLCGDCAVNPGAALDHFLQDLALDALLFLPRDPEVFSELLHEEAFRRGDSAVFPSAHDGPGGVLRALHAVVHGPFPASIDSFEVLEL